MDNDPIPSMTNDEINLKDIFKKSIKALDNGFKIILVSVLLGGILGTLYSLLTKQTYKSSLVLSSDILEYSAIEPLIESIQTLIKQRNLEALNNEFKVDKATVNTLLNLESKNLYERAKSDKINLISYFELTATVTNNEVFPELQQGITNLFNGNVYLKTRVVLRKERLKALLQTINEELEEIDSIKRGMNNKHIFNGSGTNILIAEPSGLYEQFLLMTEKQQEYKERLALAESVQIVKSFHPSAKGSNRSWIVMLVFGLGGGLLIGFVLVFLKEIFIYLNS